MRSGALFPILFLGLTVGTSQGQSFFWYDHSVDSLFRTDLLNPSEDILVTPLFDASHSGPIAVDSWHEVVYLIHHSALLSVNFDGTNLHPVAVPFSLYNNSIDGIAFDPARALVYVQLPGYETGQSCCPYWTGYKVWGCDTVYGSCHFVGDDIGPIAVGSESPVFLGPSSLFYRQGPWLFRLDIPTGIPAQIPGENAEGSYVIDPVERKIYYAHQSKHLLRSNLDGSLVETIKQNAFSRGFLFAIDANRGKLYWSDLTASQGWRTYEGNLDASGVRFIRQGGFLHACDRGDCDGDGLRTHGDARTGLLPCIFGPGIRSGADCCCADADGDGQVDLRDVAAFQRLDPSER